MATQYDKSVGEFKTYKNSSPYVKYAETYSMLKFIGDFKNLDVLDLACGYGYYALHFANNGAKSVYGVDISEEMINSANLIKKKQKLENLTYIQADVEKMNLDIKFDLICANYLLNYIPSIEGLHKVCQAMFDHLKFGGKAVCSTPCPTIAPVDYLSYGIGFSFPKDNLEMEPKDIEIKFFDNNGSPLSSVAAYLYKYSTFEKAFRQAGFDVEFRHFKVTQEGMEKFGADFWKQLFDEQPHVAIVAEKKS